MKQPTLLDVPKDSPTRKERLEVFKVQHGIWTCGVTDGYVAMLYNRALKCLGDYLDEGDPKQPMDLVSGYCRLLDDADLLVHGKSELDAIRTVCRLNDIYCDL